MKIWVLGAGNSGVSLAILAQSKGFFSVVSDSKKISPEQKQKLEHHGIAFEEEGHNCEKMAEEASAVVVSPGIPLNSPVIKFLRAKGLPLLSEIDAAMLLHDSGRLPLISEPHSANFFRNLTVTPARSIFVTGTNGKSTTTAFLAHVLGCSEKAIPCGNFGTSVSSVLASPATGLPLPFLVIETSSYQLETTQYTQPSCSIFLNIQDDHMARYKTRIEYFKMKWRSILLVAPGGLAVVTEAVLRTAISMGLALPRCALCVLRFINDAQNQPTPLVLPTSDDSLHSADTKAATGVGRGAKRESERRVHETYTSEPSEDATTANTCGCLSNLDLTLPIPTYDTLHDEPLELLLKTKKDVFYTDLNYQSASGSIDLFAEIPSFKNSHTNPQNSAGQGGRGRVSDVYMRHTQVSDDEPNEARPHFQDWYQRSLVTLKITCSRGVLLGEHNAVNFSCAAIAARFLGIENHIIQDQIDSKSSFFKGLPHRLELIYPPSDMSTPLASASLNARKKLLIYNDSKATNVESVLVALKSFSEPRVHLLLGGDPKGDSYLPLAEYFSRPIHTVYPFGRAADRIVQELGPHHPQVAPPSAGLKAATAYALSRATDDDIVLLSPGGASFDEFKNFEHRGDQFKTWIKELMLL